MAGNVTKGLAFRNYKNRRSGIIQALTEDFEMNLAKCKSVMPGTPYAQRYVLVGLDDGGYEIRHPIDNERLAPACLPPFHGHVTKKTWLLIALKSVNAWLISTLDPVFDHGSMSDSDRFSLLVSVESLSHLEDDVLSFHESRSSTSLTDKASVAASKISTHCENKSCTYIGESEWVECLVCTAWYHCRCVGIHPSDHYRRYSFICSEC